MENYLRVLVIDDNNDNLITIRASLVEIFPDVMVYTADNGPEGIKLASIIDPNIILLDINMPNMDGFEVCEVIKNQAELGDIPVIFLTALKSDYNNRMKALSVGADAFLTKPVDLLELTAQIKAMWRINIANIDKRNEQAKLNALVEQRTQQLNEAMTALQKTNSQLQDEVQMRIKSEKRLQAVKDKYHSILNDSPALICEFNINGELIYYNDVFHRYYPKTTITDDQNMIRSVVFRSMKNTWQLLFDDAVTKNDTIQEEQIEYNNSECWIEWRYQAVRDDQQKIVSFYSIGIDITEIKKKEKGVAHSFSEQQLFFKNHEAAILKFSSIDGKIIDNNTAASNFYGYNKEEFSNMTLMDLEESADWEFHKKNYSSDRIHQARHRDRLGEVKNVDIFFSQNLRNGEDINYAVVLKREEADTLQNNTISLNDTDKLTGLLNSHGFDLALSQINETDSMPIFIITLDINGLQTINEKYGYFVGDDVLVSVAKIVKMNSGDNCLLARRGADEFVMVMVNTDEERGYSKLNQIKSQFEMLNQSDGMTSASFGTAFFNGNNGTLSNKVLEAETVMNSNKIFESQSKSSKSVNLIMNALFEKSQRELMHSKRVSELCEALAYELKMEYTDIKKVKLAGLVHDIGKIGVNEQILNKPSKLDISEWEEIKKHPESGYRILSGSSEFAQISNLVLCHHERWDGTGYPHGISGLDIPLESRIIAIADAFDAMTSVRTYRNGLSEKDALDELTKYSGSQFDPYLVEIFITMVLNKG